MTDDSATCYTNLGRAVVGGWGVSAAHPPTVISEAVEKVPHREDIRQYIIPLGNLTIAPIASP